jgi:AcrR family transcriptional regulator
LTISEEPILRPPRQRRSRRTLDRIARATASLLEEKPFDQVSVSEIVERSGSSTGSFYARFRDKDGLLLHLDDQFAEQALGVWREYTEPERWRGRDLAERVRTLVGVLVRKYRERVGLLRALTLYARTRGDEAFVTRARRQNEAVVERLERLLLERREEISHPDPEVAVRFGLIEVVATLREVVLFGEDGTLPLHVDDDLLARELAESFLAYLQAGREEEDA